MSPPFPSPTPTWHNDVYPAIEPTRPNLSHKGQTIVITGAGSGIGRETAIAFGASGAKHIVLVGRSKDSLTETQNLVPKSTTCSIFTCDVTDETGMGEVAEAIGKWDILILNAGYISTPTHVAKAPIEEYWKNYETNVKSIVIAAKVFFPKATEAASVLAVTAGAMFLPTEQVVGLSGYLCSKLAQTKTLEFLAAENPNMFFSSVHPGMIDTKIFRGSGATPHKLPMDTAKLPAHFMVWLTQPEARFLNGRAVWANWDVEELKAREQEIESANQMRIGYTGWPFPHM